MRRNGCIVKAAAGAAALLVARSGLAATPEFEIVDLGQVGGGTQSFAYDVNNAGQVVGRARDSSGTSRAFRTAPNSPINPATDLIPSLSGSLYNFATAINASGQVAGYGGSAAGDRAYRRSGTTTTTINPSRGDWSYAEGINDIGHVVGGSSVQNSVMSPTEAFIWNGTTLVNLPLLTGGGYSYAYGINSTGRVVGYSETTGFQEHAFLWTPNVNNGTTGTITDLGALGGGYSYAFGINDLGHVVGQASLPGDAASHAFLRTTGPGLIDLGTLGGINSEAKAINELGIVVGNSEIASGGQRGFVYLDGVMHDLNSLLPAGSGWTITNAEGLNDFLQIVGYGTNSLGQQTAYLMSALPTWKVDANGVWSGAANWFAGPPGGAGKDVRFGDAITTARTVTMDSAFTVGRVVFNNVNRYTIAGGQTLTLSGNPGSTGVEVRSGSHTISAPVNFQTNSGINLLANTGLKLEGPVSGKLKHISLAAGSRLDLVTNKLIVDYDVDSPLVPLRQALQTGYNNGNWDGPGIVSSAAAADGSDATAIGYAEATALGLTSFNGQSLDGAALLFKYTWYGDANLDGMVDKSDLTKLAQSWQAAGPWTSGDFNYDGLVDLRDLYLLGLNWYAGVGAPLGEPTFAEALDAAGLGSVAVPEPAGLSFAGGAGMLLLCRRRRR